jgi:hypothetical protein
MVKAKSQPDREAYIRAIWLLFLQTPAKRNPELDGSYNLGEIGNDAPKNWSRATPYSPSFMSPEMEDRWKLQMK